MGQACSVHGDDFIIVGATEDLEWTVRGIEKRFDIKTEMLGPEPGMKQEVGFLNGRITWTAKRVAYEADSKHVGIVLNDLEMKDCKSVGAPMSPEDLKEAASVIDENGETDEGEYMDAASASTYRSIAARMNYLAMGRTDLQQACRCICAYMSRPLKKCCQLLKRMARYLKGRPRCVQLFPFEEMATGFRTYADSDWAGCKATRKSTSGGVITMGDSVLRSWSSVQSTMALSSGEAELYAIIRAGSFTKYMVSLASDFGMTMDGIVLSDSAAALGICQRSGLGGRTRHVQVQYLWAQDSIQKKELSICKVRGEHSLSDILTKPIGGEVLNRHLSRMQFTFPDINVGLNVCNTTRQHSSSDLIRAVSFAPIRQICMRTHDPLRPRGRGEVFGLMGPQVHGKDHLLQYRDKLRSSSRLP